jgi:hypothetical protein
MPTTYIPAFGLDSWLLVIKNSVSQSAGYTVTSVAIPIFGADLCLVHTPRDGTSAPRTFHSDCGVHAGVSREGPIEQRGSILIVANCKALKAQQEIG